MNILIIPSFFYTSQNQTLGSFFFEQAVALKKQGHNVYVLYCDTYSVKDIKGYCSYTERNLEREGIHVFRKRKFCPLKHGSGFYGVKDAFAREILSLYQEYLYDVEIDVIHAHCCFWAGYAAMKLSDYLGVPYVVTEHSSLFALETQKITGRYDAYAREIYTRATRVVCVSDALKALLAKYRTDMAVIGNVIDTQLFTLMKPNRKGSGSFRFLTVCHMKTEGQIYNKGLDILLKAFQQVNMRYPETELMIGGGGSAAAQLEHEANELGIINNVKFLGALTREQVAVQMKECDCFVLPSRYETFGVVYAEAMACGKPVIGTRTGGPDSFLLPKSGILIDVENVEQLVAAMWHMIEYGTEYNPEEIRNHVMENFSMETIGCQLTQMYSNIIGEV